MLTRDQLLADLERALRATFPETADRLVREVELRIPPEDPSDEERGTPKLSRERLLESLTRAVKDCFPDRAAVILDEVRLRFAGGGDGDPTVVDPRTPAAAERELAEGIAEAWPSLVVIAPTSSRYFAMRFPLHRARMVLGRSSSCDLFLWEDTISRRHLELFVDDERQVSVADLSSTNGSFVNEHRVESCVLRDGDHLRCGRLVMRFVSARS